MKTRRILYVLLLCVISLGMSAINYPTYRPVGGSYPGGYSGGGVDRKSESPMHGMRSTSRLGEQLAADGDYVPLPFSGDDYSSPARMALAPNRAPGGMTITAVYQRFYNTIVNVPACITKSDGGVVYFNRTIVMAYWATSVDLPQEATWAGFEDWFLSDGNIHRAWDSILPIDTPIGDGLICLLLLALAYMAYIKYRDYITNTSKV